MSAPYALSLVRSASDPDFAAAYALLDAEFGPKRELERREALEGYLAHATETLGYRIVIARDQTGAIAAVRDCHVTFSAKNELIFVYLAHVLVLSAHRGRGVGAQLREFPVELGRRAHEQLCPRGELMLAAEMEPYARGDPDSLARLQVYGRAGFRVIDPKALPYLQPDYRAPADIDASGLQPVPLLPVIRWVDRESRAELPRRLAAAYAEQLYTLVRSHCRAADLAPLEAHALGALEQTPGDTIRLLALPRDESDAAALGPLQKEVVYSYYPAASRSRT